MENEDLDVKNEETENSSESAESAETSEAVNTGEEETEFEDEEEEIDPRSQRITELSEDNSKLKGMLTQLIENQQHQTQLANQRQQVTQGYEDEEDAPTRREAELANKLTQTQNVLGDMVDKMDKLSIKSSMYAEEYLENEQEVELYRRERGSQNQYVTREDALALVLVKKGYHKRTAKRVKKVNKQKLQPVGETKKAAPMKKSSDDQTLEERLQGVKF